MDLSSYNLEQLRILSQDVQNAIKSREVQEIANAKERILAIAQEVGVPLDVILQNSQNKNKQSKPVEVKYRHPDDSKLEWTGRGRQPKWVKEWTEGGNEMAKLEVRK